MIDTNTVNYAMNKITATIGAMAPAIQNVSESYVRFIVSQQIAYLIGGVLALVFCALVILVLYKIAAKKTVNGYDNLDEGWFVIPTFILGVVGCISLIFVLVQSMDVYLAVNNPEMFTVNQIIQQAKK